MREIPQGVTFVAIVLLILVIALFTFGYVNLSGKIDRLADTGASVPAHALMMDGGGSTTETGDLWGQVFICDGNPARSTWWLIVENWTVAAPYNEPFLSFDRSTANHEKVTWNRLDGRFIVVDEGTFVSSWNEGFGSYLDANAVFIYTVDGKDYTRWTDRAVRTGCYGGAKVWYFDRPEGS
jgi:hypothetical protein